MEVVCGYAGDFLPPPTIASQARDGIDMRQLGARGAVLLALEHDFSAEKRLLTGSRPRYLAQNTRISIPCRGQTRVTAVSSFAPDGARVEVLQSFRHDMSSAPCSHQESGP